MFKEKVVELLEKETRLKKEDLERLIEVPPKLELGDYAFPCFILSKKEKEKPIEISARIIKNLKNKLPKEIYKIKQNGPYVNFFVNQNLVARAILKINANYGKSGIGKKHKIVIDFSSPNVGKPMHVGHIRSTILGDSLMRIYSYLGYDNVGINYLGDIGLHIGKLIVAYELWLNKDKLKKDPVKELLRLYVKFCTKEKSEVREGTEDEDEFTNNPWTIKAKEKLKLLELGDKKTHKVWKDVQKYSQKGFDKVYTMLKVNFHETTGQSLFSESGKAVIAKGILAGHAKAEPSGAVFIEVKKNGEKKLQKKYILRTGGIASYMTQDIGAAVTRFENYKFDEMIYLTDYRQSGHFKHLFEILKIFGYDWTNRLKHIGFGAVKFEKEILATREGKVILLEDVLNKIIKKAKAGIKKRKTSGNPELVGVGAVKYNILKNEPKKDVSFSFEEALNFEGNTGPYLQYSYARATSIINKADKENFDKFVELIPELGEFEVSLLKQIDKFPDTVISAGKNSNPAIIANYSFDLAKTFNEFYANCPVIGDASEAFRLRLINSFRTTLKNSLYLLGIEVMSEM